MYSPPYFSAIGLTLETYSLYSSGFFISILNIAIFNIDIKKPEEYKEYVSRVKPIAEKYGGEYIGRGGENEIVEGTWTYPRTVIIKFPTYEKALEWYKSEEYQPVKKIRLDNSISNAIIIKGA